MNLLMFEKYMYMRIYYW